MRKALGAILLCGTSPLLGILLNELGVATDAVVTTATKTTAETLVPLRFTAADAGRVGEK